jgi:predicted nucleic acid-binding protein
MIVVDANTLAYLWIPGEFTTLAQKALSLDPDWHSPILWRSEFRNVLAGYIRRGELDFESASRCLEGAESQMSGKELIVSSHLVMAKVLESRCSAYDCEYVALAEDLNTTLVTSDKRVLREFPILAISLKDFVGVL